MTHHAQEPVWVEVDSPDVAVLTASHHHVVRDGDDAVDPVRMSWELVRVEAVLPLAEIQRITLNTAVAVRYCNSECTL